MGLARVSPEGAHYHRHYYSYYYYYYYHYYHDSFTPLMLLFQPYAPLIQC